MNTNQIVNTFKNYKYTIYGLIALTIIVLLSLLSSCDIQPRQPSYAQQQTPAPIQQPIEYENEVHHHYYNNDNTAANLAAAAAVGAAAGYATNKYMDKQKQKQVTVPTPSKVNPVTLPVTKRTTTTSKPSFSYTTSKPSNVYRSSRRK